jgi:hypothetical protein
MIPVPSCQRNEPAMVRIVRRCVNRLACDAPGAGDHISYASLPGPLFRHQRNQILLTRPHGSPQITLSLVTRRRFTISSMPGCRRRALHRTARSATTTTRRRGVSPMVSTHDTLDRTRNIDPSRRGTAGR